MDKEFIEIAIYENLKEVNFKNHDGLCFYFSNNIKHDLEVMDVNVSMWNIRNLTNCDYNHYFLVVGDDDKYLIDLTYGQFLKKENEVSIIFEDFPGNILMQTDRGKLILNNLIDKGYFKLISDDFDIYLNSFKPKERKKIR